MVVAIDISSEKHLQMVRPVSDSSKDKEDSDVLLMKARQAGRIRLGAISLAVSAFLLALLPLVRPFGDRSTVPSEVAATFASTSWVLAHGLGTVAFVLLPFGLLSVYGHLQGSRLERRAFRGLILSWLGVGLILPVIGVEVFALSAIGQVAIQQNNLGFLDAVNSIRMGPDFVFLLAGLVVLAVGGIFLARVIWKSGTLPKWSGVMFGIGLALFFPLFPQAIRVVDGLLIGVGGIWIATSLLREKGRI